MQNIYEIVIQSIGKRRQSNIKAGTRKEETNLKRGGGGKATYIRKYTLLGSNQ